MRHALVLRPAPGAARTVARLAALGIESQAIPLFEVTPRAWSVPPGAFDAMLLTSANAVRHAGAGLAAVAHLPVVAVGEATAAAARAAGLTVALVGNGDAAGAAAAAGGRRLLHLAGREHVAVPGAVSVVVYASEAVDIADDALNVARGGVVLVHSRRAAARFAALFGAHGRGQARVAALSGAVAAALGADWGAVAVAETPDDAALVRLAARLAIDP